MSPSRPYLLRAFYDWLLDNDLTPYLVVDATRDYVDVPQQFIEDGQIVLNIAPSAVVQFDMDLEQLSFSARFGGKPFQVYVPMAAIVAIYARENGAGTVFEAESAYEVKAEPEVSSVPTELKSADLSPAKEGEPKPSKSNKRPSLRVIK